MEKQHKSGFVNILGSPNMGKSTLMNVLVGENLSAITHKAQTTRHRIMGIVNGEDYQIVFSDTPGILKPSYKLHEGMMGFVKTSLSDADVILFVTDTKESTFPDEEILAKIQKTKSPLLILINKIDLSTQEQLINRVNHWHEVFPKAEILPISALNKLNTGLSLEKIISLLPVCPPYYPKDELTDKSERFFVSEIIREKILLNYNKEVPYSCEVLIESFKEEKKMIRIRANIMVARNSQKGIIIGHKGEMLKKVGQESRIDMEKFLNKKVFLELFVKVDEDWRNNEQKLKKYGYIN